MSLALDDARLDIHSANVRRSLGELEAGVGRAVLILTLLQLLYELYVQRYINYRIEPALRKMVDLEMDRDFLLARAQGYGRLAASWNSFCDRWESHLGRRARGRASRLIVNEISRNLDLITCWFEDVSELFALSASEEFRELVEKEVREVSSASPSG